MKRVLMTLALVMAYAIPAIAQQPKQITMNDVPPQVMAAALEAANGVKFERVAIEFDNGTAKYEFVGKLPNGRAYEVDVLSNGQVEEVEEEIGLDAVPKVVLETLNRFFPNLKPSKIERSIRRNFSVWYEFDAKDQRGKELDIEISADGRRILIQDDDAG